MTEAPHGTAPSLQGKNVANPMAMILAVACLLGYMKDDKAHQASRAIYESALEAVSDGIRTADLGGHASTTDFTRRGGPPGAHQGRGLELARRRPKVKALRYLALGDSYTIGTGASSEAHN